MTLLIHDWTFWLNVTKSALCFQSDSDSRFGMRSSLLNTSDDGDSKRAKLSYSNRALYSRSSSASLTGSAYSTNGLSSGRGK